ncbi:acetyl-CoA synthetase-like protein [Parathielavia hyrcaniae]|uniref:Acetyl-CoA synthetase-like protein n=1 Tax=Parathielavia hyrcaniae TaxID=113614 RepID=A0AAN6PVA7_9PEZI|nr:acetyl-CoA synthetase-like protein [Parathielavia hyrcaniae]
MAHPDISLGFPNEPLWIGLLERARTIPEAILNDTTLGVKISLAQLLHDVAHVRRKLREMLPSAFFEPAHDGGGGLIKASAPYIGLSTRPNYEFYVAALAILSVGGAIVRVRPISSEEENLQVLRECQVSGILTGPEQLASCQALTDLGEAQGYPLQLIPLQIPSLMSVGGADTAAELAKPQADTTGIHVNKMQTISPDRPALVIRTTGTTGGPKSAVHTRRLFYRTMPGQAGDLTLIHENLVWISGTVAIMLRVLSGSRGEILPTNPGPAAIWERLRRGGVTRLTGYSWFWERLAEHFQQHIAPLPDDDDAEGTSCRREEYIRGARGLRSALITGTPPPPWLLAFWKSAFGRVLHVGFVATELGEVALMTSSRDEYIEGALGRPFPGATVKLSEGDHGELLVKTQYLFSHYIAGPEKTRRAFDAEGYFKTGDLAHVEGDIYVFDGRIGSDIIRVGSEDVSLVRLDHELANSESIAELCTVCIPPNDGSDSPTLGILVRFHDRLSVKEVQGARDQLLLRTERRLGSMSAKLPYHIRVLGQDEEIPRTFNMKPFRRMAVRKYFAS